MEESQYTSDNTRTTNVDPLTTILAEMSAKLKGIGRLEKKLEELTANFTGELDSLKTELANLWEARTNDGVELNRLQASVRGVTDDLHRNEEEQGKIERKLDKIICKFRF